MVVNGSQWITPNHSFARQTAFHKFQASWSLIEWTKQLLPWKHNYSGVLWIWMPGPTVHRHFSYNSTHNQVNIIALPNIQRLIFQSISICILTMYIHVPLNSWHKHQHGIVLAKPSFQWVNGLLILYYCTFWVANIRTLDCLYFHDIIIYYTCTCMRVGGVSSCTSMRQYIPVQNSSCYAVSIG